MTLNKWREICRRKSLPEAGEAALCGIIQPDAAAEQERREYCRQLAARALKLMRTEFQETTWRACCECVVAGRPPADVARELGITVNAVYVAKSRVLRRLHQELHGLLD